MFFFFNQEALWISLVFYHFIVLVEKLRVFIFFYIEQDV